MPKILTVDDDDFQHTLIRYSLSELQCELEFAKTGDEARQLINQCPPDLVLLDIGLPGDNGLEVLSSLKNSTTTAHIPVIMLTGDSQSDSIQECMQMGATDFLVKPFERDKLIERISGIISD